MTAPAADSLPTSVHGPPLTVAMKNLRWLKSATIGAPRWSSPSQDAAIVDSLELSIGTLGFTGPAESVRPVIVFVALVESLPDLSRASTSHWTSAPGVSPSSWNVVSLETNAWYAPPSP